MEFPINGSINNTLRNMKMNMAWQKRKLNPNMPKGLELDPKIASLQKQAEDVRKSNIISNIDGKLKAGAEITDDELEYLRVNSPELYKKALEVKREREEYKRELERCRTKEDVERLNARKLQNFMSETNSIRANPNIGEGKKVELLEQILRRMTGIQSEHKAFLKSKSYSDLPRERELEEDKNNKKKELAEIKSSEDDLKDFARKLADYLNEQSKALKDMAQSTEKSKEDDSQTAKNVNGKRDKTDMATVENPAGKATAQSQSIDVLISGATYNSKGKISYPTQFTPSPPFASSAASTQPTAYIPSTAYASPPAKVSTGKAKISTTA